MSGLVFFLIEKESRLVRFHAMQSILLCLVIAVAGIVLWIVTFIFILIGAALPDILGTLLGLVASLVWLAFSVGLLITWVMCLIRAYQYQYSSCTDWQHAEKIVTRERLNLLQGE